MITLLIATLNRSDFLIPLLRYYGELEFEGRIIIGDSSGPDHSQRTKAVIKDLQGKVQIDYTHQPGQSNRQCIESLTGLVSTDYIAVVPDDDFFVPSSLERCVSFLDDHDDYIAARRNL